MNYQMIGLVFAIAGALATVGYFILGVSWLKALRDIRDRLGPGSTR